MVTSKKTNNSLTLQNQLPLLDKAKINKRTIFLKDGREEKKKERKSERERKKPLSLSGNSDSNQNSKNHNQSLSCPTSVTWTVVVMLINEKACKHVLRILVKNPPIYELIYWKRKWEAKMKNADSIFPFSQSQSVLR